MNITYVLLQTKKATLSAPAISILVEACHELRVLDHLSNPYRRVFIFTFGRYIFYDTIFYLRRNNNVVIGKHVDWLGNKV